MSGERRQWAGRGEREKKIADFCDMVWFREIYSAHIKHSRVIGCEGKY